MQQLPGRSSMNTKQHLVPQHDKTAKRVSRRARCRCGITLGAMIALCGTGISTPALMAQGLVLSSQQASKPNIVFILMHNLGYGEVGCYGRGELRGAPTPRIDKLAGEGTRLT